MVDLHIHDGELAVSVKGLHRLWALKSTIRVPISALSSVRRVDPAAISSWWVGWRAPGTHVPGIIIAGTYYKDGERHFWDVRQPDRAIEIRLEGARYHRLFVEVADPDEAIRRLEAQLPRGR
jgi:hypothetical protein